MIEINRGEGGKNLDIAVKDQTGTPFSISGFSGIQIAILTPKGRVLKRTAVVGAGSGVIDGVTYPAGTWARYVTVNGELQELGTHKGQIIWINSTLEQGTTGYADFFNLVQSALGGC